MTVNGKTIKAKGLGDFFKELGKKGLNVSKKMAKKRLKQPRTSLTFNTRIS